MGGELSIVRLVMQASLVVQIVLGILLIASISSWAIIFRKRMVVNRARRDADRFENSFWSGGDLSTLYRSVEARGKTSGMESIFEFGFREFARLRAQGGVAADMLLEGSRRAMRVAQLKEIERLGRSLRQVYLDPLGQQRRRDHENDQQHQHYIDIRHHVDLAHEAALALVSCGHVSLLAGPRA